MRRLIALVVIGLMVGQSKADSITWGSAQQISGDSDVATNGTLVYAYSSLASTQSVTVNGVTFSTYDGPSMIALIGFIAGTEGSNGFDSTASPFTNLSTDYQTLVANGQYGDMSASGTNMGIVSLQGLTVGQTYEVEIWVNDSRNATVATRDETLSGTNSPTLAFNTTQSSGGLGQFIIGTFVAGNYYQLFDITQGNGDTYQINSLEVRNITGLVVPEPSSLALCGIAAFVGLAVVRVRRKRSSSGTHSME